MEVSTNQRQKAAANYTPYENLSPTEQAWSDIIEDLLPIAGFTKYGAKSYGNFSNGDIGGGVGDAILSLLSIPNGIAGNAIAYGGKLATKAAEEIPRIAQKVALSKVPNWAKTPSRLDAMKALDDMWPDYAFVPNDVEGQLAKQIGKQYRPEVGRGYPDFYDAEPLSAFATGFEKTPGGTPKLTSPDLGIVLDTVPYNGPLYPGVNVETKYPPLGIFERSARPVAEEIGPQFNFSYIEQPPNREQIAGLYKYFGEKNPKLPPSQKYEGAAKASQEIQQRKYTTQGVPKKDPQYWEPTETGSNPPWLLDDYHKRYFPEPSRKRMVGDTPKSRFELYADQGYVETPNGWVQGGRGTRG